MRWQRLCSLGRETETETEAATESESEPESQRQRLRLRLRLRLRQRWRTAQLAAYELSSYHQTADADDGLNAEDSH